VPAAVGQRKRIDSPSCSSRSLAEIRTMLDRFSRRLDRLADRTPCQPSITLGPDVRHPNRNLPFDSSCRLSADVASIADYANPAAPTNVPSLIVRCLGRHVCPVQSARRSPTPRAPTTNRHRCVSAGLGELHCAGQPGLDHGADLHGCLAFRVVPARPRASLACFNGALPRISQR